MDEWELIRNAQLWRKSPHCSTREPSEWEVIEYVRDVLIDIRQKLRAGTTLTDDERMKVRACLRDPAFAKGREPVNLLTVQRMRLQCLLLERSGTSTKAAVDDIAKAFRCSRSTVYAARKARITPSK